MLWRWIHIVISGPCGDKIGHGIGGCGGERPAGWGFGRGWVWRVWGLASKLRAALAGWCRRDGQVCAVAFGLRVYLEPRWARRRGRDLPRSRCPKTATGQDETSGRSTAILDHRNLNAPRIGP